MIKMHFSIVLKYLLLTTLILLFNLLNLPSLSGQTHKLSTSVDAPLLGSGGLAFGLSIPLQKKLPVLKKEDIMRLDPQLIRPTFDQIATRQYYDWAQKTSDITLNASILSPLVLLLDQRSRNETGTIGLMYLEAFLINNGITGLFKAGFKRTRPYVYNPNADFPLKMKPNARLSFFSGHASNSATFSFFAAKVFSDNNPDNKWSPVVWSTAAILPAVTGYMRVKAGKHFPTDVIVGYAVGAAVGILIPALHK